MFPLDIGIGHRLQLVGTLVLYFALRVQVKADIHSSCMPSLLCDQLLLAPVTPQYLISGIMHMCKDMVISAEPETGNSTILFCGAEYSPKLSLQSHATVN